MDAEIARLLKRRQNGYFSDRDKIRLRELIDVREAIEVRYNLTPADTDGFSEIGKKVEAAVARAQAQSRQDADVSVYEDAIVAAGEGMAAINQSLNEQYDKEYAVIRLIEDSAEKQRALDELNARYNQERRDTALEYAQTLSGVVTPVWNQEDIREAKVQAGELFTALRRYSMASAKDKPAILTELQNLSSKMDEGAMAEYLSLMTQIQSLLDSGMSEAEVQALFPDVDFSAQLDQFAGIVSYLDLIKTDLPGLFSLLGEALPDEVLKIATDLDMTGAQARWDEFAANPGAITTDAVVNRYTEAENADRVQPHVDAFIDKYTEKAEGADTASLTPDGILAYVNAYAEATTGADVSSLTPGNVTAMVAAYDELASGADASALKPDDITAYIMTYLEGEGADASALSPDALTAFVMAYEEITGGASETALTPDGITAMVAKYLEAEGVDLTALSPEQIEALVNAYAEAVNCDKSELLPAFTAYITEYREAEDVTVSQPRTRVVITGYDYLGYKRFERENPDIELDIPIRLGELDEGALDRYIADEKLKVWQDGVEIPVDAVPQEQLTADTVAVLDGDGTMHVLITPEVTGSTEAIEDVSKALTEKAVPLSIYGSFTTVDLGFLNDLYGSDVFERMEWLTMSLDNYARNIKGTWKDWRLIGSTVKDYNRRINSEISPETAAKLQTYVAEMVTALRNGEEVGEEDLAHLRTILDFVDSLNASGAGAGFLSGITENLNRAGITASVETLAAELRTALDTAMRDVDGSAAGEQIIAGLGRGMEGANQSAASEATAANTESGLNAAYQIHSPSRRMQPVGSAVAAGIGLGMRAYDFESAASATAAALASALTAAMPSSKFGVIGRRAMDGLKQGIRNGTADVVDAIRAAARTAVSAAKDELKIQSPSRVFRDEVGAMVMKGFGEGVFRATEAQARILSNAARYLVTTTRSGVSNTTYDQRRTTYNQDSSATIQVQQLVVRDEQDVRSLAIEISALTRRQQRGKGMRFA